MAVESSENSGRPPRGRLIMAASHLGCIADLPVRSCAALRSADLLIFEEDRAARQCLKAAGVHRDYRRYSEHRQEETLSALEEALRQGQTALYMSDQGTPGLADPGRDLVAIAYRLGAKVEVIPGPSSVAAAIAACPFECRSFRFAGFLPREPRDREAALRTIATSDEPTVVLDTPYRLQALLSACAAALGSERRLLLALDISGGQESFHVGSCQQLLQRAQQLSEKLNFVLIIDRR